MLRRKMSVFLAQWRATKERECLLVKGARQVGKSYIIDAFGRENYDSYISIDFVAHPEYKRIFAGPLEADDIYRQMSLFIPDIRFAEHDTFIFLDEIQECPRARTALKYLALDNRYDVVASGSLLGIQYRQADEVASIPVGYERIVEMHPLDFEEYLWAKGFDEAAVALLRHYLDDLEPVPLGVHESMMGLLREYLAIGGMPEVVQTFLDSNSYGDVFATQTKLLASYLDDIARYASETDRVKARSCFLSLPRQLAKENTKFRYALVEKGGTSRKFDSSVDWIAGANMVLRCTSVSTPSFPLAAYEDDSKFRLYANDTGLLMAMYGFESLAPVVYNTLAGPMKGGLYENLVAGMLAKNGIPLHYWMSQNGSHEIEFLVDRNGSPVPVEVKARRGATASLNALLERDDIALGYKLIDGNVGRDGKKITLPLYLAPFLFQREPYRSFPSTTL